MYLQSCRTSIEYVQSVHEAENDTHELRTSQSRSEQRNLNVRVVVVTDAANVRTPPFGMQILKKTRTLIQLPTEEL